jgi:hypothetical protein
MFRKHVYEGEDIIEIYFVEMWPGSCNVYQGQNKNKNILL